MEVSENLEVAEAYFSQDFPRFFSFITTEIRVLEFASDLAASSGRESISQSLNLEAKKLSIALNNVVQYYTSDLP
ncbi:hypothetical protein [Tenacibaculum agarivorans]|uniref:hypothetical protein n=1 Tax=Tenacibaculum agarivorans TaxID=1908389 RepID=UPI00094BB91A|nr:hypothetical protein [Tenacibaculum agarivorans]